MPRSRAIHVGFHLCCAVGIKLMRCTMHSNKLSSTIASFQLERERVIRLDAENVRPQDGGGFFRALNPCKESRNEPCKESRN